MIDTVSLAPTGPAYQLAPSVYLAVCDETSRVVDLDRGRFLGLDAIATRLLALTLESGPAVATATVAREYDTPEAQVDADLHALLAQLIGLGALRGFGPAPSRRWRDLLKVPLAWLARPGRWAPGVPTVRATGRLLRRAWFSLRQFGWCGSIERWRSWAPAAQLAPLESGQRRELIEGIDAVVCAAAARTMVFAAACKERALAAYYLLRVVHGLPAELVIGVEHYPFGAHAWVEIDGRVVSDDQEHCARFVPVARHA